VTPSPTSVPDNGTSGSTVTVTLKDSSGTPIPGQTVTLTQDSGGNSHITTVSGVTNAQGQATFSVTDTSSQVVTYTADDVTGGVTLINTGSVTFHGPVSASTSTEVASPTSVADNGTSASTITVTLLDFSRTPVSGQVVSLAQGGGRSIITAVSATTNAQGQATFSASDTTSEVVTYTATDTSQSNLVITETAQVAFHAPVSQSNSTVTPSLTSVADNGISSSIVTVTLRDASGTPIPGQTVTLAQSSGGHSAITTLSGAAKAQGQATFSVTDTSSHVVTYTADDVTGGATLTNTGSVTFHGLVSPSKSTVEVSQGTVPANGTSSSTITV